MSNRIDTKIVLGSERFKTSTDVDSGLAISLESTQKEIDEFDRSQVVSLSDVFENERQTSSFFRVSVNLDLIFDNFYDGISPYNKFTNQLSYSDPDNSFITNVWKGFPQYKEFDLSRTDNNIDGYTSGLNPHINFQNKDCNFYNWNYYISYPYENVYDKKMLYYFFNKSISFNSGDGIPFVIQQPLSQNGQTLIAFNCATNHNLKLGDYAELKVNNKIYTEEVYSIIDNRIFCLLLNNKNGSIYLNYNLGVFKRITDIKNPVESKSLYYVRKHRILTNYDDAILNKAGFDINGFGYKKKFEFSSITPNKISRISELTNGQSYVLSFKKDIDISKYIDNLKRPITKLFITIVNRGRFGWFNKPIQNNSAVREGFFFNIDKSGLKAVDDYWGQTNNSVNLSNLKTTNFNQNGFNFYYNNFLTVNEELNGDFCEFNQYEQEEYVLSELYHKFYFNDNVFQINGSGTLNPPGFYYKPHNPIVLRVYSDYLEEEVIDNVDGVPNYAFYSSSNNSLIWRDIYSYGFIDDQGKGVDYPFLNGSHYPFNKIIFKVKPEGYAASQSFTSVSAQPETDECE
jgi:hypothetical protein